MKNKQKKVITYSVIILILVLAIIAAYYFLSVKPSCEYDAKFVEPDSCLVNSIQCRGINCETIVGNNRCGDVYNACQDALKCDCESKSIYITDEVGLSDTKGIISEPEFGASDTKE